MTTKALRYKAELGTLPDLALTVGLRASDQEHTASLVSSSSGSGQALTEVKYRHSTSVRRNNPGFHLHFPFTVFCLYVSISVYVFNAHGSTVVHR